MVALCQTAAPVGAAAQSRSVVAIVVSDVPSKRRMAARLARALERSGHRSLLVLSDGDEPEPGLETLRGGLRVAVDDRPRSPLEQRRAIRTAADRVASIRDERLAVIFGASPDLIVVDIEEYETLLALLATADRPPLASLCTFFDVFPSPGIGPNETVPLEGALRIPRSWLSWRWTWLRMRLHDVKRQVMARGTDRIAVSRRLARRWGVRRELTMRQWLHPFVPRRLPMLVTNALELDLPHTPRPGVHHIGSLVDPVEPVPVDEVEERMRAARADGKVVVLCSFGTVRTDDEHSLVPRLVALARRRADLLLVLAGAGDDELGADVPSNLITQRWVDQRSLLRHADAAIVHTGNATLHECVLARVPVVAYPFSSNDQPRNAARVRHHLIGEVGDRRRDDVQTINDRVHRVVGDAALAERLDRLAGSLERYQVDSVAVACIEALLDGGHSSFTEE